jgi:fibronectin-binding autotransporter adhesin
VSLVGSNSFTGLTTISAGTLQFGGGGTIVSNIVNNSVLGLSGAGASEYAATISGSGAMIKSGAGTLTFTGTSSSSGDITIAGGTLDVVEGGAINQPASVLYVAPTSGTATMSLSGGSVTVAESYVGFTDNGAATISSGQWATVNDLHVGRSATGTLDVSGGLVTNRDAYVGSFDGGNGVATVTGGTWSSNRDMQVGYLGGTGTLTIANGGVVAVGGTLSTGTSGTINLNAGGTLQIGQGGLTGGLATSLVNNGLLVFNRADDSTYSGSIGGLGALTKQGAGTLTFAGANSYTGLTTISGGTLALSGSGSIGTGGLDLGTGGTFDLTALASGTYTLPATGSLTGVGTLSGTGHTLAVLGAFQPGNSPGTVTLGPDFTLALALTSTSTFQITSPLYTPGTYDLVNGAGRVAFGGVLELDFSNGEYALGTNVLQLFANDGGWSGDFTAVYSTGLAAGQLATFNASNGYISIIPEPSSYILAAIGAGLVGLLQRRRRRPATVRVQSAR